MAAAAAKMAMSSATAGGTEQVSFFKDPCTWVYNWFCTSPADNCVFLSIIAGGVVCMIIAVIGSNEWIIAVVGGLVLFIAANRVWALRSLAAEIDRFKQENERLEATEQRLEGEVEFLGQKKDELTGHVTKLEGTVGDLQGVSEGLQDELQQFQNLKGIFNHQFLTLSDCLGNIEKFAAETGADVKNILGEANKIHAKMERMTNQNERALLGKIAQDIEFLDKDSGMREDEFNDFFARIPVHLQNRFKALGLTFQRVAGDDGIIDFMEIEDMINKLMAETDDKIDSIHV